MSRLSAVCRKCERSGSRDEFFRERPGSVPAFGDVCPNCGSENIDVIDTVASAIAARAMNGSGGSRAAAI
jgi:Zn finger protein HypA/HybF involved in hydrogenase expression